jgi:N-acetyl-1-D-myo-inositol-2-amino-2-deoxy-alpha-D-glucopyranoside deacetylase
VPTGSRRLLAVHAHPDDETLSTGPTLARYAAEGARVTVVTCTLGEQGEVIPADLRHLQADADALGAHRAGELDAAMGALGVADHRLLADGRWRDSGMAWVESGVAGAATHPAPRDAFAMADRAEAAGALADVLREVRPQAVVTYDPRGGNGHPDHIKAHEITTVAMELVTSDSYRPTMFWVREPRSWADAERSELQRRVLPPGMSGPDPDAAYPSAVVDDAVVTTVVDGSAYLDRVRAALEAHRTQVRLDGDFYALSNGEAHLLSGCNAFQRIGAPAGQPWTDDLFS